MRKPTFALALIPLLSLLALGCGEDPPSKLPELPPHMRGNNQQQQATPVAMSSDGTVAVPNERWDRIKVYFESYSGAVTSGRRDPYRNYLASYAQKPDLPAVVETELEPDQPEEVVEIRSPLEKYAVEDFELLMVMSGTSRPKAVVLDPLGVPWVIRPDTPLGNKGGLVQAITQYSIVVAEPGAEAPSEITIRPMILDAAAELSLQEEGQFTSRPLTTAPMK